MASLNATIVAVELIIPEKEADANELLASQEVRIYLHLVKSKTAKN